MGSEMEMVDERGGMVFLLGDNESQGEEMTFFS